MQGIACHFFNVPHLVFGQARRPLEQAAGQLAFERDNRKAVAQQVMKVAREAQPLLAHSQASNLLAGQGKLLVGLDQQPSGDGGGVLTAKPRSNNEPRTTATHRKRPSAPPAMRVQNQAQMSPLPSRSVNAITRSIAAKGLVRMVAIGSA